jgi:multiple sugar transport system ATP-binding protein
MAAVSLERLTRSFGSGRPAVRDLTLDVADGELLVLVGPSGCGKSTVLRLVAGLDTPTTGRVLIDGRDMTAVAPQQRDVAMVFQSYALYPHMTVRENLGFGLHVRGARAAEIEDAIQRTAAMLGIAALLDRRPAQLSGGQRQRVAVGRALARRARVYLLDEPLSNLDPLLRTETRTELGLLHRSLGATMIYVTHDQEEAMTLGTRIAVMREGTLAQVGAPMDLSLQPANRFVAGFIGAPAMNLVPAAVVRGGGDASDACTVASPILSRALRPTSWAGVPSGNIELGFRPQDVQLIDEPDRADGYARVASVEPMGAHTLVHAVSEAPGEPRLRVVVQPEVAPRVGQRVGFAIRTDRVHLFDSATGARLH